MKPFLFPQPQKLITAPGIHEVKEAYTVCLPEDFVPVLRTVCALFSNRKPNLSRAEGCADIILSKRSGHSREGYSLFMQPKGIRIEFSEAAGAFYGLITLCQLLLQDGPVPCCQIEDCAGLKIRGVMMDISRGKVPSLDTLKQIADRLAQFKINHFELYIEGWPYAYPGYENFWEKETPITPKELGELSAYCRERFIDLTPCQNGLGHMGRWLSNEELRTLAECEDGFSVGGYTFPPTTLNPSDERCLNFVKELFDGLLPCFDSKLCNACLDEPFEFCMGKNKDRQKDKYKLYTGYANGLNRLLKERGKQMMMWGDVLARDDEMLENLDRDILILDWGYEKEHPAAKRAKRLADAGYSFCLCPGTNSWLSFTGMTDNMLACIQNTAAAAWKYGAEGLIVTDWGDMGHLQYLPVSWAGILAAAAYAWNENGTDEKGLAAALDRFVFMDRAGVMGQLCLDAGRYCQYEEFRIPCRTLASTVLSSGLVTKEEYEKTLQFAAQSITFFTKEDFCKTYLNSYENRKKINGEAIRNYIREISGRLSQSDMHCADSKTVLAEYRNALKMAEVMTGLREVMLEDASADGLGAVLDGVITEHRRLWHIRNKACGCEEGLKPILKIREGMSG